MSAGRADLICEQGATFSRGLSYADEDGVPFDLTGCDIRMKVKDGFGGALIIDLNIANGRIVVDDAPNGIFSLVISDTDTAALTAGKYKYDLELDDGSITERLLEGCFVVKAEVTD